jgi:hypothetical protein
MNTTTTPGERPLNSIGNLQCPDGVDLPSRCQGKSMFWSLLAYLIVSAAAVASLGYLAWYGLRRILKW